MYWKKQIDIGYIFRPLKFHSASPLSIKNLKPLIMNYQQTYQNNEYTQLTSTLRTQNSGGKNSLRRF